MKGERGNGDLEPYLVATRVESTNRGIEESMRIKKSEEATQ